MKTLLKLSVYASLIILIVIGCKKIVSNENTFDADSGKEFNTVFVKEWYYGTFKKSAEWESSPLKGKKLPDWKNGIYHKVGNMEIVEFPLGKAITKIGISSSIALSSSQKERLANAALTRVLFIKNSKGDISIREIDYIPDWQYLQNKQFDISKVSYGKELDDFTGKMVVKNWAGTILSLRLLRKGQITHTGKIKDKLPSETNNTNNIEGCTTWEICEYERHCEYTMIGDQMEIVCGEWAPTGLCWTEEYCNGDPCGNMTEEQCACMVYGNCESQQENCEEAQVTLNEMVNAVSTSNELISITTESETPEIRVKVYQWKILTSMGGWYIFSFDKGTHQKVNNNTNPWQWNTFTHESITMVGTVLGGTIEPSLLSATSTVGLYNAVMDVHFKVKYSVLCSISPINYTLVYNSNEKFNIND